MKQESMTYLVIMKYRIINTVGKIEKRYIRKVNFCVKSKIFTKIIASAMSVMMIFR